MHQVLLISEIVTHIFYYLTNKADQFTAIRICKAWFDIGIDHLWRDIEDVRFIFRILAPIVKSSYGTWSFATTPSSENWRRFNFYASKVRIVSSPPLEFYKQMDPSDFVIDVLSLGGTRTSDLPLLPSLESIGRKSTPSNTNTSELVSPASFNKNYVINDSNGIKLASMLPNAHIHAVFLGINIPRDGEYPEYLLDELIQLMVLMGAHSQGLKTLYVTSLAGSMSLKASELSLGNKTELEEVYIGTLGSSEALHDFSALPKLKYLDIQVAWQEAESDWNTGCFSSLEVLHLRRGQSTGGSPIRLFGPGRYTTPRLRQVKSISQDDDGHLSLISDLTHCRDTLEDVSLYRVTNQSPILVHLQQFNTEMQTLASALPRLRELRIWLANLTLVVSPHTVLSIWYLLNGCLDLEILQLEVDGTKQMPFPEEQVSAPDKHRVVKTELGGFRKGDPDWKRIWFQELAMRLNVHFDWGIYAGVYAWT